MPQQSKHFRRAVVGSSVNTAPAAWYSRPELLAGAGLIALAALLAYLPALGGDFVLDDDRLLTESPLIAAPDGLYRIWCTTEPIDYWPLTNSSFWIEWRLWGRNPTGYHVTNLVLHVASALLIWVILSKLSIPGAWLAALLFAVHPVNVESVAWISQRKNTLSMLFFLVSILWYLKADRDVGLRLRRERSAERRWYWSSLLAFTLAMLSKGSVAILPLVLLILAWWQRGSITRRDLARTAPFFVVAVVLTIVNIWFQKHGSTESIRDVTFVQRLLGAGAVVWFYLYKALLPVNLVFIYPQWDVQAGDWRWWAPLAAAVSVTALLFWQRNSRFGRPLLFAWLFFCVALAPVMGFTDVGFMKYSLVADRYLHIAVIGVVTLVAAGTSLLYQRWRGPARSATVATASIVAAALTLLSWNQSSLYASPVTLYEATLGKNPNCSLVHNNLGHALNNRLQYQEAIEHLQQALRLEPDYPLAYYNLGNALYETGRHQEAVEHYRQALRLKPDFLEVHFNLGNALASSGQWPEAIEHFEHALRMKTDHPEIHVNLGNALTQTGRRQEAIEHFQQALRLRPDDLLALFNLAGAYSDTGRLSDAVTEAQRALELARSSGQTARAEQFEEQLKRYRARLPKQHDAPSRIDVAP